MNHISEEALEELAMGRHSRYRSERLREHLLSCQECRLRFAFENEFEMALRLAGRKLGIAKARPRCRRRP